MSRNSMNTESMNTIWVLIPAYNEEKYISQVLKKVKKYSRNIVVVDDGSTDKTASIVREQGYTCLSHLVNLGKGAALKTGCEYIFNKRKGKIVVTIDADDQHDPSEIPAMVKPLHTVDMVLGSRVSRSGMPITRMWGNQLSSKIIELLTGVYIADIPSGYKAFTKQAYDKIVWNSTGYEVETEIAVRLAKSNLKYVEIPIKTIYHDAVKGFTVLDGLRVLSKIPTWLYA